MLLTTRSRTVLDCVRLLPERPATELLDRAFQLKWIDFDELVHRGHELVGRSGAPRVAKLVRTMGSGARSEAERRLVAILRRAGMTGWQANVPIEENGVVIAVGDLVFERSRLVIEVDGWAYHVTPERFQRDRDRQNRLIAAGWTVLRFTWSDLRTRPGHVVAVIRDAVRSPSIR
jgi:very-short-patch-repair endonuclease